MSFSYQEKLDLENKENKENKRKRIKNQQKIEEKRNSTFYHEIRQIKRYYAWIHSMICLYFNDTCQDDNEEKINIVYHHLEQFEKALTWHYTKGINEWIEKIKILLGDEFIDEEENEENEEKEEEEEKEWANEYENNKYKNKIKELFFPKIHSKL